MDLYLNHVGPYHMHPIKQALLESRQGGRDKEAREVTCVHQGRWPVAGTATHNRQNVTSRPAGYAVCSTEPCLSQWACSGGHAANTREGSKHRSGTLTKETQGGQCAIARKQHVIQTRPCLPQWLCRCETLQTRGKDASIGEAL